MPRIPQGNFESLKSNSSKSFETYWKIVENFIPGKLIRTGSEIVTLDMLQVVDISIVSVQLHIIQSNLLEGLIPFSSRRIQYYWTLLGTYS